MLKRKLLPKEIKKRRSEKYFEGELNNWKGRYNESLMCKDLRDYIQNEDEKPTKD